MPYRIDISSPPPDTLDKLVKWGALDIEPIFDGIAAILPDGVTPESVAASLGVARIAVSSVVGRDDGSVWLLAPRDVRVGSVRIAPWQDPPSLHALRLTDSRAFGSGHHPTTVLCLEAIEEALNIGVPDSMLDVGTGSGVLALASLHMGVPRADALEIDADALNIAAENARLNNLENRLHLILGGPEVVAGLWPLVVANVLAAPLIEMAPVLVQRLGNRGRLILSGIATSLESEVWGAYQRLGLRHIRSQESEGWMVVVAQAAW